MEKTNTGLTLEELSKIKEAYTEFTPEQAAGILETLKNDLKEKMNEFPIEPNSLLYPLDVVRAEVLEGTPVTSQIEKYLHAECRLEFTRAYQPIWESWKRREISYEEFNKRRIELHNKIYGLLLPEGYEADARIYQ